MVLVHRCRAALEGVSEGIRAEAVVLPDGEQHKSTEVLMQVCALGFCSQCLPSRLLGFSASLNNCPARCIPLTSSSYNRRV